MKVSINILFFNKLILKELEEFNTDKNMCRRVLKMSPKKKKQCTPVCIPKKWFEAFQAILYFKGKYAYPVRMAEAEYPGPTGMSNLQDQTSFRAHYDDTQYLRVFSCKSHAKKVQFKHFFTCPNGPSIFRLYFSYRKYDFSRLPFLDPLSPLSLLHGCSLRF
jgi:hypothetical protein